jgi:hypothetical protein
MSAVELALNLAWMLLSLTIILWFTMNDRNWSGRDRVRAVIALGLVVMILLPVISMTDDLLATRFPAEIEQIQTQHKKVALAHALLEPFADTMEFHPADGNLQAPIADRVPLRETKIPAPLDILRGYRSTHGVRPPLDLRIA